MEGEKTLYSLVRSLEIEVAVDHYSQTVPYLVKRSISPVCGSPGGTTQPSIFDESKSRPQYRPEICLEQQHPCNGCRSMPPTGCR